MAKSPFHDSLVGRKAAPVMHDSEVGRVLPALVAGSGGGGNFSELLRPPAGQMPATPSPRLEAVSPELHAALQKWNQGSGLIDPTRTGTDPGIVKALKGQFSAGPWQGGTDWTGFVHGRGFFGERRAPGNAFIGGELLGPGGSAPITVGEGEGGSALDFLKSFDPRSGAGALNWAGMLAGGKGMPRGGYGPQPKGGWGLPERSAPSHVTGFTIHRVTPYRVSSRGTPSRPIDHQYLDHTGRPVTLLRQGGKMGSARRGRGSGGTVPVAYNIVNDLTGEIVASAKMMVGRKNVTLSSWYLKHELQNAIHRVGYRGSEAPRGISSGFVRDLMDITLGTFARGKNMHTTIVNPPLARWVDKQQRRGKLPGTIFDSGGHARSAASRSDPGYLSPEQSARMQEIIAQRTQRQGDAGWRADPLPRTPLEQALNDRFERGVRDLRDQRTDLNQQRHSLNQQLQDLLETRHEPRSPDLYQTHLLERRDLARRLDDVVEALRNLPDEPLVDDAFIAAAEREVAARPITYSERDYAQPASDLMRASARNRQRAMQHERLTTWREERARLADELHDLVTGPRRDPDVDVVQQERYMDALRERIDLLDQRVAQAREQARPQPRPESGFSQDEFDRAAAELARERGALEVNRRVNQRQHREAQQRGLTTNPTHPHPVGDPAQNLANTLAMHLTEDGFEAEAMSIVAQNRDPEVQVQKLLEYMSEAGYPDDMITFYEMQLSPTSQGFGQLDEPPF